MAEKYLQRTDEALQTYDFMPRSHTPSSVEIPTPTLQHNPATYAIEAFIHEGRVQFDIVDTLLQHRQQSATHLYEITTLAMLNKTFEDLARQFHYCIIHMATAKEHADPIYDGVTTGDVKIILAELGTILACLEELPDEDDTDN